MQHPDEKKRRKITGIAARMFATRAFHEVRLDEVASAAGVGKGTLYIYFKSKEDLYLTLVHDAFTSVLRRLREDIQEDTPVTQALEIIVRGIVAAAFEHPEFFELVRTVIRPREHPNMAHLFQELSAYIAGTLRRGVREGVFGDAHPELTAVMIPGLVRSAMLHRPANLTEEVLSGQILRLLRTGLVKRERR